MNRTLALLALLAIAEPAHAADTEPAEMLTVLVMDDARMGQVRYLNLLLDRSNIAVADSEMNSCLKRMVTAEDAATCIRFGSKPSSPRELTLILSDAGPADRERPGLARLVCVGAGDSASDPNRQSITLWPRAYGLRSATPYIEDGQRLRNCMAAAQAEAVP